MLLDVRTGRHGRHRAAPRRGWATRTRTAASRLRRPIRRASPSDALSCAGVTDLACPVAESPSHSSMPLSRRLREREALAVRREADPRQQRLAVAASPSARAPSAIDFSVIARDSCATMRAVGSRVDAHVRRSAASAARARAMVGMLARSSSAITSRVGLNSTVGGGGASRMSTIALGGSR